MESSSPIDLQELSAKFDDDREFVQELIDLFVSDCTNLIQETRVAIQQRDPVLLGNAAHQIKGTCANMEALAMKEWAYQLEQMGKGGTVPEEAQMLLQNLEIEFKRVADYLKTF